MRELERGDKSDAEADVASTAGQIIVSAGNQRGPGSIELESAPSGDMQNQVMFCNIPPYAKPGAARHGVGQSRQVGPDVIAEFTDDKVAPVTTGPPRRWFLKPR